MNDDAELSAQTALTGELAFERQSEEELLVRLRGSWLLRGERPDVAEVERELDRQPVKSLRFEAGNLAAWDSGLLVFLANCLELFQRRSVGGRSVEVDLTGLPSGVQRLLTLSSAVPEKQGARQSIVQSSLLARIGTWATALSARQVDFVSFLGESTLGVLRCLRFQARFRASDLFFHIQQAGAEALPIVTLIAFLVGLIMAFVGAVQLERFGASIYLADLVGLAMTREMGAMMTAIIMAGRTGAAYAAQLGTMKVTEEIDALTTLGISPLDFLVLPRMIALFVMMPLLCLYADLVGMIGGAFVATGMLDLTLTQYTQELISSVTLTQIAIGVVKAALFGVLVALSGCYQGMRCGNSASSVGEAATSSVVVSIVAIVTTDGILAVMCNILKI